MDFGGSIMARKSTRRGPYTSFILLNPNLKLVFTICKIPSLQREYARPTRAVPPTSEVYISLNIVPANRRIAAHIIKHRMIKPSTATHQKSCQIDARSSVGRKRWNVVNIFRWTSRALNSAFLPADTRRTLTCVQVSVFVHHHFPGPHCLTANSFNTMGMGMGNGPNVQYVNTGTKDTKFRNKDVIPALPDAPRPAARPETLQDLTRSWKDAIIEVNYARDRRNTADSDWWDAKSSVHQKRYAAITDLEQTDLPLLFRLASIGSRGRFTRGKCTLAWQIVTIECVDSVPLAAVTRWLCYGRFRGDINALHCP
ncbi:hypothetical protein C8R44DRAFT_846466 [Mycena epipterygia]|nr:hypothetical protein C8R44DRAFT_846466 [Mycena epipterygia]